MGMKNSADGLTRVTIIKAVLGLIAFFALIKHQEIS